MWDFWKSSEDDALEGESAPLTFLGKGAELKGTIHVAGSARVDGIIEGEVHVQGTLVVGKSALIKGDVTAEAVVSSGNITGDVMASERVKLLTPCVLMGSVQTPLLSVEEGVLISGTCDMVVASNGHRDVDVIEEDKESFHEDHAHQKVPEQQAPYSEEYERF